MFLFAFLSSAFPCAGLLHDSDFLAESDAQEVIFSSDGDTTTVEYKVQFFGDAENFGWVIPFFGDFVSLEDGEEERFELIRSRTQPVVYSQYLDSGGEASSGVGCRGARMDKALGGSVDEGDFESNSIEVTAEGFTGSYEYIVISANEPADLAPWLAENGWETGATQEAIDEYASEEGVYFALIKLTDVEYNEENQELPPVKITYQGTQMRFPAMMARYGNSLVRTRIYVTGDQGAQVNGWTSTTMEINGDIDDDPTTLYDNAILEIGGNNSSYLNSYIGFYYSYEGENLGWVSRFDTLVNPSAHTLDSVFTLNGGEDQVHLQINLIESEVDQSYLFLPVLLLGIGWSRRRRT
jgi:hypothetical protein